MSDLVFDSVSSGSYMVSVERICAAANQQRSNHELSISSTVDDDPEDDEQATNTKTSTFLFSENHRLQHANLSLKTILSLSSVL